MPSTDEGMQCILVAETKPAVGFFITMMVHLLIPRRFVSAHAESGEAIGYQAGVMEAQLISHNARDHALLLTA